MSLSSRSSDCYGATDEGEIIHSTDGINWDIFNFNNVYSGFYRPCSFSSILVTENRIAVAGKQDDGFPVVAFSSQGNVWTERVLNYIDEGGFREFLTESPNFILYDETGDQFFIACTNGLIMVLPSCSQCNKVAKVSDRSIKSMVIASGRIMLAGEGYFLKTIGTGW